jgi:hypothetical protein
MNTSSTISVARSETSQASLRESMCGSAEIIGLLVIHNSSKITHTGGMIQRGK